MIKKKQKKIRCSKKKDFIENYKVPFILMKNCTALFFQANEKFHEKKFVWQMYRISIARIVFIV